VSWFSFRRKRLSDEQLRTALFDSVAAGDTRKVECLVRQHSERLAALFPSTVPAEVRADPRRTKWWVEGEIGVAKAAARFGDNSMMARLLGPPGDNIIITWQNALRSALSEANKGSYTSAILILEDIMERTRGLTGSGVDSLLPKTYGMLGGAYCRTGDRDIGRAYTVQAKEYCERIGDVEGVEVYAKHLRIIDGDDSQADQRA
jgi:hypothetical protein